jgi:transcriptional regulator of acetoin/glycerol metabolism
MLNKEIQGVDSKVLEFFNDYPWPGNVRELQNIIERAINFAKESIIRIEDLQENLAKFLDQKPMEPPILDIRLVEKEQLVKALKLSHGNVAKTAKALGISRPTVYKKSKKYNIKLEKRK